MSGFQNRPHSITGYFVKIEAQCFDNRMFSLLDASVTECFYNRTKCRVVKHCHLTKRPVIGSCDLITRYFVRISKLSFVFRSFCSFLSFFGSFACTCLCTCIFFTLTWRCRSSSDGDGRACVRDAVSTWLSTWLGEKSGGVLAQWQKHSRFGLFACSVC